ncbi:glycosyltransferase [Flavobacterium sp. I3-2]|uniref:glycosyltransferase n=1 Tax=Flavobacterium sp. I3-2 TaxID=2748319 RepID=UPI0015B22842|nr:glycosyltransferase [Flavobacterium sp. I3-2]
MSSILLHAWTLHKKDNQYYMPYTHWIYLKEIVKYYDKVCLLSPVNLNLKDETKFESVSMFKNVRIYELPYTEGYIQAIKHFFTYVDAYKTLSKEYDKVYARYPIPFGWLQASFFKNKKRIIHFVGDPTDTIINNPNLSPLKKKIYTTFFKPEHLMFMKASKHATVFTNGFHLTERLKKYDIKALPLVSSTLNDEDFFFEEKKINQLSPKLIYLGYLRKAKGLDTLITSFKFLQENIPNASLTIVGHGEMEEELKVMIDNQNIKNVIFKGHIDNRKELNSILRSNDIFAFASLSEGSPRVILEAMANGLAVVSTPVGSLPTTFTDGKEILFADFNNPKMFVDKYLQIINNNNTYNNIRRSSFQKVSNYKIENFLKSIFYEA